jgi:hypothetical protein
MKGHDVSQDYSLDEGQRLRYDYYIASRYSFPFFGLGSSFGSGIRRKSRLMLAISFRVGTRCKGDFGL